MMKQPELGQKISSLRKAQGLTQEDLVERCNISVRTIQRIESGDVSPRPYTVKLLLDTLGYDLQAITDEASWLERSVDQVLTFFYLQGQEHKAPAIKSDLKLALAFGIVSFILGFVEAGFDFNFWSVEITGVMHWVYTMLKGASWSATLFFFRGFLIIGDIHQSALLKIITILLIASYAATMIYDIAAAGWDSIAFEFVLGMEALTFGVLGLAFGIALFRLGKQYGLSAKLAGSGEVLCGLCFLTFFLAPVGLVLLIPITVLELIVLYQALENT